MRKAGIRLERGINSRKSWDYWKRRERKDQVLGSTSGHLGTALSAPGGDTAPCLIPLGGFWSLYLCFLVKASLREGERWVIRSWRWRLVPTADFLRFPLALCHPGAPGSIRTRLRAGAQGDVTAAVVASEGTEPRAGLRRSRCRKAGLRCHQPVW